MSLGLQAGRAEAPVTTAGAKRAKPSSAAPIHIPLIKAAVSTALLREQLSELVRLLAAPQALVESN